MSKFKPLYNHVIVKKVEEQLSTNSTIIVPDMGTDKPFHGEVIEVGEGDITVTGERIPPQVQVGDKIVFGNFSGVKFYYQGDEYICLKDREIFTIIK